MKFSLRSLLAAAVLLLATTLWPESGRTQTRPLRVGVLTIDQATDWMAPFQKILREHGWIEGENLGFEFRNAGGNPSRIGEGAAELVALNVDVLFPVGPPSVRAAFAATRTVPIVAHDLETDPVAIGYARSYAHPGGNLTGLFLDSPDLELIN